MALKDKSPMDAVADIAEGAVATYYIARATSRDPRYVENDGRTIPTVKVRSTPEYAAVAAGQITILHVILGVLGKIFWVPFICLSFVGVVMLPIQLLTTTGPPAPDTASGVSPLIPIPFIVVIAMALICFWVYFCLWRWTFKRFLNWMLKEGPAISYTDGYKGPLGSGHRRVTPR